MEQIAESLENLLQVHGMKHLTKEEEAEEADNAQRQIEFNSKDEANIQNKKNYILDNKMQIIILFYFS